MHPNTATPVLLDRGSAERGPRLVIALEHSPASVDSALDAARALASLPSSPGRGSTRDLWETLATIAARDLGAARVVEPHLDARGILEQASSHDTDDDSTWGVFAAEGGDARLEASEGRQGWTLDGIKPWCSLADRVDRALVTAWVGDERALFAVSLLHPGVQPEADVWHARGLAEIASGPVRFSAVAATQIGARGWYLDRPGFAWGGMGVAACWFGGAVGVARSVLAAATRADASPFLLMHLGAIDELVESGRRALAEAATLVDSGAATGSRGSLLAKRVRATVARAAGEIVDRAGRALGPGPLALDAEHAKRVVDLGLYLRQHHGERDEHSLGRTLVATGVSPW